MSTKEITIRTAEGNTIGLIAVRQLRFGKRMVTPFMFQPTGEVFKKVTVKYGIGIAGEGASLTEAVANFRSNWTAACAAR